MTHAGKFKIAVVGVSTEPAKEFLPKLFYSRIAKLVAVCDENLESLKDVCEKYVINGYHTYEDLMENEEIDFTITTVQHGTRPPETCPNKTTDKK